MKQNLYILALLGISNAITLRDDIMDGPDAEDNEIMDSLKSAENELGVKMVTPKRVAQEGWQPVKYDVEEVQLYSKIRNQSNLRDDIMDGPDAEDAEIMDSLKSAENELGVRMVTPKRVAQEGWQPVKYDVEEVQIGSKIRNLSNLRDDIMDGPDAEDAEIMDSLKSAENELGVRMVTPKRVAQEGWQPVKYDVEEVQIGSKIRNLSNLRDDIMDGPDAEDAEIMDSLKSAENELGVKMVTPKRVAQEGWQPVKYDVEEIQIGSQISGSGDGTNQACIYATMNHWNQDPHSIPTPLKCKAQSGSLQNPGADWPYKGPEGPNPADHLQYNVHSHLPNFNKYYGNGY